MQTDAGHREAVAHGGTAQSLAPRLLAGPIRNDSSSLCTSFTTDRITSRPRRKDSRASRASRVHTAGLRRGTAYSSGDHTNAIPGDTAMNRRQMMKAFPALAAAATAVAHAMPAEAQAVT